MIVCINFSCTIKYILCIYIDRCNLRFRVIFFLKLTVEELDDIGEVHGVGEDDVAVGLEQRQRDEQHHVLRRHVPRRPDQLPR